MRERPPASPEARPLDGPPGPGPTDPVRQRHRPDAILAPVTSNISQSYPYTSETEAERATAIEAFLAAHKDLAAKVPAETTPLDERERWWVWKCPTPGCPGLLHAAGYARDLHAVYVVCDGTCSKTFLR